jgi:hypothetical protein
MIKFAMIYSNMRRKKIVLTFVDYIKKNYLSMIRWHLSNTSSKVTHLLGLPKGFNIYIKYKKNKTMLCGPRFSASHNKTMLSPS